MCKNAVLCGNGLTPVNLDWSKLKLQITDEKINEIEKLKLVFGWVENIVEQEGHDGPASLHWLISKIPSYKTLQYLGIGLKHKT